VGLPLIGDPLYSKGRPAVRLVLQRQALHACRLALVHPLHGGVVSWFRAPAPDLEDLMRRIGFDPSGPMNVFDGKARA
jgi:23S rRNA pseudouridine1911/1915/1917 synthase